MRRKANGGRVPIPTMDAINAMRVSEDDHAVAFAGRRSGQDIVLEIEFHSGRTCTVALDHVGIGHFVETLRALLPPGFAPHVVSPAIGLSTPEEAAIQVGHRSA